MLNYILAALLVLGGIGGVVWSLTAGVITGVHMAVIAVACFMFAAALGVWHIAGSIDEFLEKRGDD